MNKVVKELILRNNDSFLLNKIYSEIIKYGISDEEVASTIEELAEMDLIKVENLRGEFWQTKIIPLARE